MSGLTIGNLSLSPSFDPTVTEYTLTTTNNQNKVTATPADENAEVEISVGITPIENATAATWETGENNVTIKVTNGTSVTTYTVVVTKE